MPSGNAVANVSLATTESWKDRRSGERTERTEWHRVVFYSRLAEIARDYLRKGSKVYVEGRLQTRKYQDRDGVDRYTTEVIANDLQMLDSRGGGPANNFDAPASRPSGPPESAPPGRDGGLSPAFEGEDPDDEIPF